MYTYVPVFYVPVGDTNLSSNVYLTSTQFMTEVLAALQLIRTPSGGPAGPS